MIVGVTAATCANVILSSSGAGDYIISIIGIIGCVGTTIVWRFLAKAKNEVI